VSKLKQMKTWFGFRGEMPFSKPSADSRGQLAVVDPTNGDDELWVCLRDAAGTLRYVSLSTASRWPNPMQGAQKHYYANPNLTTFTAVGAPAIALTSPVAASNTDSDIGPYVSVSTTAVNGSMAEFLAGTSFRRDWAPQIVLSAQQGNSSTSKRVWMGAFASTPEGSDDPAIHGAGFRFSTSAGDTNFMAWSNDGSGGGTIVDTGVDYANNVVNRFAMDFTDDEIRFFISESNSPDDWVLVHTATTNLPGLTTDLTLRVQIVSLSNNTRVMRLSRMSWLHER
jgi:hypothetical protein